MMRILFLKLLLITSSICFAQKKNNIVKGEVLYHVFLRSYYDSNGDMQGDLNGLKQKLPYLQDLGVTSVLLLPLYDADCYHNYFANDFEKIDPEFGTMQEYISLVEEVHKRGMKIYMDMETQYVAEKHLWWKDAVGNLQSPYSDFILFDDLEHKIPATMLFDLRQLNSYDGTSIKITTVNLKNKNVLEYNKKLFSFFVDPNKDGKFDDGVDGFRLDHAMDHLDGKLQLTNLFAHFWEPLLTHLKTINPALKNVAEQSDWNDYGFNYFEKTGVDRMFGFGLQKAILSFKKQLLIGKADTILAKCPSGKEQIIFLENHDLDRFASVETSIEKQKLAAALLCLIGGVPSIYYGQEIGMKGKNGNWGNTDANDIPRREAFEWYTANQGKGMATWYHANSIRKFDENLKSNDGISVEEQLNNKLSLLNYYKKLIRLKQSNPALATGKYANAPNDNENVFSFYRIVENRKVLVAVNLSSNTEKAKFEDEHKRYKLLMGTSTIKDQKIELEPYQIAVLEVKK